MTVPTRRGAVRVAGLFTVESLPPHRVLPMGEDPYLAELLAADDELPSPLAGEGAARTRSVGAAGERSSGQDSLTRLAVAALRLATLSRKGRG